jgi:hypothetical protein
MARRRDRGKELREGLTDLQHVRATAITYTKLTTWKSTYGCIRTVHCAIDVTRFCPEGSPGLLHGDTPRPSTLTLSDILQVRLGCLIKIAAAGRLAGLVESTDEASKSLDCQQCMCRLLCPSDHCCKLRGICVVTTFHCPFVLLTLTHRDWCESEVYRVLSRPPL